jgi:acetyl-CoA C-acetyltransferase
MRRTSGVTVAALGGRRLLQTLLCRGLHTSPNDVVIVSAVRTPIGSILSSLADVPAPALGSTAVRAALEKAGIKGNQVDEVILGNVVSAGIGQAPARQASLGAGIPENVPCTTINKVCASGMKSIVYGAQSIALGQSNVVVTGGFESMSNIPFYLLGARKGFKYGHTQLTDGVLHDGLTDAYSHEHMGMCGDACATKHNISRKEQDDFAVLSYKRAAEATEKGYFKNELVSVTIPQKKGDPIVVSEDEEYKKVKFDKIPKLPPAFKKDGTVTAANASSLNDGASALVLMSAAKASALGLKPLARIRGYADAERAPVEFTVAPADAIPKALKNAGIDDPKSVDLWEINEAFSVVVLANAKLLNLPIEKVNVHGGAVALGHPIGASGARIVTTLVHALHQRGGKLGVAAICNGGGGATALVVERL